jgi:tRNA(Ile)-lysidine synthase
VLAIEAGCTVDAVHVHHGLRPSADDDAAVARTLAERLGATFRLVHVDVEEGPNLEARARAARRSALGDRAMTGHTADDQAETVLLALLRGSGAAGLGAIGPGHRHPILALRRAETRSLCVERGLTVVEDPTNTDPRFRRNRIRHELVPLLCDIAARDVTPLLTRTADLLRSDEQFLDELAAHVDPTDATGLARAPRVLGARAVRHWLQHDGYPPDADTVARVLAVAAGDAAASEVGLGRRVERHGDRLVLLPAHRTDPLDRYPDVPL